MAYSVVPTAVTGDLWTAANANTYWRDNFAATIPDIFTAAGDMVYATGADAATVLPIGNTGEYLVANDAGTAPEWGSVFCGCAIAKTASQTATALDTTTLTFDTEYFDHTGFWSTDDTDAITVPQQGIYQCSGTITMAESTGSYIFLAYVGDQGVVSQQSYSEQPTSLSFCYTNRFNASANVRLRIYVNGTTDIDITYAHYSVMKVGTT